MDANKFCEMLEAAYGVEYTQPIRYLISKKLGKISNIDLRLLYSTIIESQGMSKWYRSPPDWNTIKDYIESCIIPVKLEYKEQGDDTCVKCQYVYRYDSTNPDSYKCPKCGYDPIDALEKIKTKISLKPKSWRRDKTYRGKRRRNKTNGGKL